MKELEVARMHRQRDHGIRAKYRCPVHVCLAVLLSGSAVLPVAYAADSHTAKVRSQRIHLDGPGDTGPTPCDVVQVLNSEGKPIEYFMDVASVACADGQCQVVTVRIHFDLLGDYQRYELPTGGDLTKWGHKPFSRADHRKLHQILSDPYSQLKSIAWDQITPPKGPAVPGSNFDAISGPTPLSRRNMVVVGAAYTCFTLWHWSHGQVVNVIRDMTVSASDDRDFLQYLQSDQSKYVVFAANQLQMRKQFDAETIDAVIQVVRHGDDSVIASALSYLMKASSETGVDHFFRCYDEDGVLASSAKRIRFLEALRDTTLQAPSDYFNQFCGWIARADSYYEVHLLLSLLERENVNSAEAVSGAMTLLERDNPVVIRRSYRFLKAQDLNDSQQERLRAFEKEHPDP
jgi:hypothetical protein